MTFSLIFSFKPFMLSFFSFLLVFPLIIPRPLSVLISVYATNCFFVKKIYYPIKTHWSRRQSSTFTGCLGAFILCSAQTFCISSRDTWPKASVLLDKVFRCPFPRDGIFERTKPIVDKCWRVTIISYIC